MGILDFLKPDVEKLERNRDIEGLIKTLAHRNRDIRKQAIKSLITIGEPAFEQLYQAIEDNDNELRKTASEVIGMINGVGVAILRGGLVKFCNSKVPEMTGYNKRELIGKQFIKFVAPEHKETVLKRYKKRISFEWAPERYQIEILSKEGGKIPVEIKASLIEHEGRTADLGLLTRLMK
jgi:PAS domain S-box-containing protein